MLGGLWNLIKGIFMGALTVAVIVFIVVSCVGIVMGDETIATRPARLGEQDRRITGYEAPIHMAEEHTHEIIQEVDSLVEFQCTETNLYLLAMLEYIARSIARNPDLGYIYKDAIVAIRESWCDD